jgi:hypothetical protein
VKRLPLEADDVVIGAGLVLLVIGVWRLWGSGVAYMAAGALLTVTGLIMSLPRKKR